MVEDTAHAGGPQSCDPSHQHACTDPRPPACQPSPPPSPPSLDTQETSVRGDFDKWLNEHGTEADWHRAPVIDESSLSSNFRHSGWKVQRRRVFEAMQRTQQTPSRVRSFGECGTYSWIERATDQENTYRVRHNHCNDRLCTPCANERAARLQAAVLSLLPPTGVSFITLTLCGKGEPLTDLLDRLYKHFRALRLHPIWTDNVLGGAAFLEIKWSDKAQRWHPHLHILAIARYMEQGHLTEAWRSISRDSFIVDIRRVRDPQGVGRYVTKYASKPLNTSFGNTPTLLDEALQALKGRRLCLCFGSWYGTALTDAEEEDLDYDANTHWHQFAPLEDVLRNANAGQADAINVLKLAGVEGLWRAALDSS